MLVGVCFFLFRPHKLIPCEPFRHRAPFKPKGCLSPRWGPSERKKKEKKKEQEVIVAIICVAARGHP